MAVGRGGTAVRASARAHLGHAAPPRRLLPARASDGGKSSSSISSSSPTPASGATKAEIAGLEAGISAITAALQLHERLTGGGRRRAAAAAGGGNSKHPHPSHHPHNHGGKRRALAPTKPREWKRVSVRGKASGERQVEEEPWEEEEEEQEGEAAAAETSQQQPPWSLRSYLALPVEQYSVLDPRFIRRLGPEEQQQDSGGGSEAAVASSSPSSTSSAFRLTVPLSDVVGMDIVVEVDVAVDVDPSTAGVSFRADRLVLGGSALAAGGPAEALSRAEIALQLEARLGSPRSTTTTTTITRPLKLEADARVSLRVPPPLSAAPAPLLGATGSLVARLAMRALLPPFLDLLAADYARWAREERGKVRRRRIGGGGGGEEDGGGGRAAALDQAVGSLMAVGAAAVVAEDPRPVVEEVVVEVVEAVGVRREG